MSNSAIKLSDEHFTLLYQILNTMHHCAEAVDTEQENRIILLSNASLITDIIRALNLVVDNK